LAAYTSWVDVFLQDSYSRFCVLVIDTSGLDWRELKAECAGKTKSDRKRASAFHQFMLVSFGKLRDTKRWSVILDRGLFNRDERVDQVEFLFNRTYKKAFGPKVSRTIRMARPRDSKQEDLIQLADVLLGVVSHKVRQVTPGSIGRRGVFISCDEQLRKAPQTKTGLNKLEVHQWVPPSRFKYP